MIWPPRQYAVFAVCIAGLGARISAPMALRNRTYYMSDELRLCYFNHLRHEVDHVQIVRGMGQVDVLEGPLAGGQSGRQYVLGSGQVRSETGK